MQKLYKFKDGKMGLLEKFLSLLNCLPKNILVFENITSKEPVIEAFTLKGAEIAAEQKKLKHPVFKIRQPLGAYHVHQ